MCKENSLWSTTPQGSIVEKGHSLVKTIVEDDESSVCHINFPECNRDTDFPQEGGGGV